jgi:hypothetical protein
LNCFNPADTTLGTGDLEYVLVAGGIGGASFLVDSGHVEGGRREKRTGLAMFLYGVKTRI